MEETFLVNLGGDILCLPVAAFSTGKNLLYLNQPAMSGDETRLFARAKVGWERYKAVTGTPTELTGTGRILKRSKFQFWLRNRLTHWGII